MTIKKKINEASVGICMENPAMLKSRARLLDAARDLVDSSYKFKKGKSRSKRYLAESNTSVPKRRKLSQEFRESRMKEIEDEIKVINERISYKEKRRTMAETVRNYKLCEEVTEEIGDLQKQRNQLEAELKELKKKDNKSSWYRHRKYISLSSSDSKAPTPIPLSSSNNPQEASDFSGGADESHDCSYSPSFDTGPQIF